VRSRDRGCNGHRILRRVLVGGRHLGSSRAISFHEAVVKATLAASSHGKGVTLARANVEKETRRRSESSRPVRVPTREMRKRRQRCQRLDRLAGAVGRQRPRSGPFVPATVRKPSRGNMAACDQHRSAEAFSGAVKHPVPRSSTRSPRLRGDPRDESRGVSREHTRYGYT